MAGRASGGTRRRRGHLGQVPSLASSARAQLLGAGASTDCHNVSLAVTAGFWPKTTMDKCTSGPLDGGPTRERPCGRASMMGPSTRRVLCGTKRPGTPSCSRARSPRPLRTSGCTEARMESIPSCSMTTTVTATPRSLLDMACAALDTPPPTPPRTASASTTSSIRTVKGLNLIKSSFSTTVSPPPSPPSWC